ncbi:hypothetical protein BN946_scf185043.g118 [Trametes cinnabarina]|uniref:Uncharacterized protein n=1 Tax=Pycnoporus cinnabarinus TaxID=5643 RepID=A0A060SNP2_PYCCI|nr:hypothetical protein BN946_scf185043.g118 [Trametes cinnabarina]
MRPTGSMSDTDVEEEPTQVNKASKSKKAKGLNMPAGLALMHGFSATNVGKNRLTIRNVPHTGVFSKGKASVKTAVKKGKHARSTPASNVFSEERFLSKSGGEARTFSDNEVSDDEQGKATEGRLSVFEEDLATRKRSCQNDSVQRKRTRSVTDPPLPGDDALKSQRSENISSRPKKRARAERMASPIWDIELASGGLPSDSSDQHQPIATEVTRASGTIIVDTRRDGVKWAAVEPAVANLEPGADADSKSSQDVPTNASSLAPSQSASQAALRCHDMSSETPAAILSKYFTEPTLAAPRVEAAKLQDTPFTAPVEPTSNPPRVTMGQLTGGRGAHPGYGSSSDQCLPFTTPTPASTASLPSSFSRVDRGYVPDRPVSPRILDHDSASLHTDSQLSWLAGPPSPALSHAPALAHSDILGHSLLIGDVPPSGRSSSKHKSAPFRQHGRRRVDLSRRPYSPASPSHADLPKTEARRTRPISETDSYMDLVFSDSVVAEQHAEPFTYPGFSAHSASYDGVTDRPGDPRSFTAMSNLSSDSLGFDDIFLADYQNAPALTYLGEMDGTPVDQNGCECGSSDLIYPSRWRQQNTHDTTALHAWHYVGIGEDFPVSSPHISEVADTAEVPSFDISDADRSSGYLAWRRPFDDDAGVISDFERDVVDTTTGFDGGATIMEVEPVEFEVDDPVSESELECSVLDSLQRFSQGRALLCGILDVGAAPVNSSSGAELAKAEVDVVRSLKGHWQPQRF